MYRQTNNASVNRYKAKNYDRVNLEMPKGQKEVIKDHAEKHGEKVNQFINRAILETIERDNQSEEKD